MILITGAGGKTGRSLIKALSKVESVCALVHREAYISVVRSLGAERIILGDMRDESAIHSAMQGMRAVYHVCPNMSPNEVVIGKLLIEGSHRARVTHFVYHSVLHPQTEKMQHHWQKLRVEEMIFESGLAFTILQPAPYMQNLLGEWQNLLKNGVLRVPYSVDAMFSFVDLEDIAEAATVVLTEPSHKNATYELAGTLPMSHVEIAEILGRVLNRVIRAKQEAIGDWRLRAGQSRISAYAVENLVKMFAYYDRWGLVGNPNVLKWILRREPTSFELFVQRILIERDEIH